MKEMLIEKQARFDEVDENIKQWLENVEIPGHEIHGEDEIVGSLSEATTALEKNGEVKGEEDEIASSVCVPLQAALESADLLLRFMEQQDGTSTTDILNLRKIKMNINKKLSAAEVQKKMTPLEKEPVNFIVLTGPLCHCLYCNRLPTLLIMSIVQLLK